VPSLVQLEYIVAVADLKHFSKAAEACHSSGQWSLNASEVPRGHFADSEVTVISKVNLRR